MAVKEISLVDNNQRLRQNAAGLLLGDDRIMDLGAGAPIAAGEVTVAEDTTGQNMAPSGALVQATAEAGSLIKVAVFAADPAAPEQGDLWALDDGVNRWLKLRIGGTTYAVQLT